MSTMSKRRALSHNIAGSQQPRRPAVETTLSLQPFSSHLRKVTHPWLPHHDGQAAQAPRSSYRSCGISFTSQVNKVSKSRLSSDNTLLAIKHWVFSSSTKICGLAFHFLSCDHLSSFFSLLGLLRAKHNRDFQEYFVKGDRSLPNRKIFCFYLLWECPTLLFQHAKVSLPQATELREVSPPDELLQPHSKCVSW